MVLSSDWPSIPGTRVIHDCSNNADMYYLIEDNIIGGKLPIK
jgi:hypothetical protein